MVRKRVIPSGMVERAPGARMFVSPTSAVFSDSHQVLSGSSSVGEAKSGAGTAAALTLLLLAAKPLLPASMVSAISKSRVGSLSGRRECESRVEGCLVKVGASCVLFTLEGRREIGENIFCEGLLVARVVNVGLARTALRGGVLKRAGVIGTESTSLKMKGSLGDASFQGGFWISRCLSNG